MRWRTARYGETLKEALITEGLATLFEEESTSKIPIYAQVKITSAQIKLSQENYTNKKYSHYEWFIGGNDKIPKWFGYTYGYQLAKDTSRKLNKSAAELVNDKLDIL